MKNIIVIITIAILLVGAVFSYSISQESKANEINYKQTTLISDDYIFGNNDYLYKPWKIRINEKTKEIFISDVGNFCICVFDYQGKFIRKFMRKGQGPGEVMTYFDFFLDEDGSVYISDSMNNRISIYSREGKYIGQLAKSDLTKNGGKFRLLDMFMNKDNIILNLPNFGYYFSVFSKSGDLIKNIGEIDDFKKGSQLGDFNIQYAKGIPIVDKSGNSYIFLPNRFMIRKYDMNGKHIKDVFLDKYNSELTDLINKALPEKQNSISTYNLLSCAIYKNDRLYFLFREPPYKKPTYKSTIMELDEDLRLIKKHILTFEDDVLVLNSPDNTFNFDILTINNEIRFIMPIPKKSIVLQFVKN